MNKKKVVTIKVEVPCYSAKQALKCAESLTGVIEDLHAPVRMSARGNTYVVKGVNVS